MKRSGLHVWHLVVGLGRGGAESLLVSILPRLAEEGQKVQVVALKGWGPVGDDLEAAGISVTALGGRGRRDPRPVWRLLRKLRQEQPDRVHAHLTRAVIAAGWACRWTGTPLVAHFHSLAGDRPRWQDRLEGAAARRAVARVAVSRSVARDRAGCLGLPQDAFQVIANGVVPARFAGVPALSVRRGRPLSCGFLGRLQTRDKGLDLLLQAMARLGDAAGARLTLDIAGGPPATMRALSLQARDLGLGNSVRFLGEVADPVATLAGWDLLVLPSRREGFGLVLVEAMAAGRPVLASDAGGIPEVVEDGVNGWLVPAGDAGALADALAGLSERREDVVTCGARARLDAAARFDVAATASAWAGVSLDPEKAAT